MDEWTSDRASEGRDVEAQFTQDGAFRRAVPGRAAASLPHPRSTRHGAVGLGTRAERAVDADAAIEDRLVTLLDEVHEELANHRVRAPYARLVDELAHLMGGIDQETVRQRLRPRCVRHPIRERPPPTGAHREHDRCPGRRGR